MPRTLTGLVVLVVAVLMAVLVGANAGSAEVVSRPGTIAFLRFSPDAWSSGDGETSLYTIRADGNHLRRLTPPGSQVYGYEWSPDGRRIAYTDARGSLWVVNADGTRRRRLAGSLLRSFSVSWSPNGKSLAVVSSDPADRRHTQLSIVSAEGGKPRRLPPVDAQSAAWSPTGNQIAYSNGTGRIELIRPDGTDPRVLHYGGGGPEWSADGTLIGLSTAVHRGCRFCVDRYAGIAVLRADGDAFHVVTTHAYNEYGFAWSPAGQKILYGRAKRSGIYVMDADGRHDRRVTSDSPMPVGWGALTWSPDGRLIAYDTDRTGAGDIYVIGVNGHDRVQLTRSADVDVAPSWAP